MARTTPAQKPRGEHSSTLRAGFSGVFIMSASEIAPIFREFLPPDMGCAAPPCQDGMVARVRPQSLYSGHFPIIIDDLVLRPAGGRSVEEICHGHTSTLDAEGDRRLAVG